MNLKYFEKDRNKILRIFCAISSMLAVFGVLFLSACSPEAPKLIPQPVVVNDQVKASPDGVVFNPKVDVLFVVDDSGSMNTHQANLSKNISLFTQAFSSSLQIDYHIGVVSTDMSSLTSSGRLKGRVHRFIERTTPDGIKELSKNLLLGINGSGTEMVFDPVMAALTQPLEATHNAGFYRPNNHLAVIFITDAEDQSRVLNAQKLYDFLLSLKKQREKILAYGVIVPSGATTCDRDNEGDEPHKIEEFLSLVVNRGANVMNLCDPQFGIKLAELSKDIAKHVGGVVYLNRAPILSTIVVKYGTQIIPEGYGSGWVFDPSRNAIILGDDIQWTVQPEGTKLEVLFDAAQFPEENK